MKYSQRFVVIFLLFLGFSAPMTAADNPGSMRELERDIESMKEQILKEKIKLRQLEEALLYGKINSTQAYITLRNEAQGLFQLQGGEFFLNGKSIRKLSVEEIKLDQAKFVVVHSGEVPAGENTLSLQLRFKGQKQGPFTYVEEYTFNLDSKKIFSVTQGKTQAIDIVITDRGFVKNELKDRLSVSYNITSGT